jgi:membrane-associated phospholipid phosphatase
MSESKENLSNKGLLAIGIVFIATLLIGIILIIPADLNEAFYSDTGQSVFKIITYLGEPIVFIIIAAILYIAYNKVYAKNLALSLLFTHYLNQVFKGIFKDPRPAPNIDPLEDYGFVEPSYGFPSGHSQTAVGFWGYAGYGFKDTYKVKNIQIIPCVLSVIIFLVAISRLIIGVHDLQDVIGGLLLGIGFLLLFIYLEPILSKLFNKLNFIAKVIVTVIISVALFLVGTLIFPEAGLGLVTPPALFKDKGAFAVVGGVLLGFGVGYLLEQEYVKYDPSQLTTSKKIINIIIGIVLLLITFVPFEYLLEIDSVYFRFFRYALVAFILAFVVPLICKKIS